MAPQNNQQETKSQTYGKWATITLTTLAIIASLYGGVMAIKGSLDSQYLGDALAHGTTQKLITELQDARHKEIDELQEALQQDIHKEHDQTRLALKSIELQTSDLEVKILKAKLNAQIESLRSRRDFLMSINDPDSIVEREIEYLRAKIDDINSQLSFL